MHVVSQLNAKLTRFIAGAAAMFLACALFALGCPSSAHADVRKADLVMGQSVEARALSVSDCPNLDCEYALVMDSKGTVYFERNSTEPTQIASITKVMTALVALDVIGENFDEYTIEVSEEAAYIGESTAGLQEGDTMDAYTALQALMVPSGNDAAQALAECLGDELEGDGDAYDNFVAAMNAKAKELGCTDTVFENPHGLDFDEYDGDLHSTARDVAIIVKAAMENESFREIVAGGSTTIKVTRDGQTESIDLETTDGFLDLYEYAIGVKTGFTELAGACFAGAANNEKIELYAVVLNSTSEEQRFYDCQTLCEWVYAHQIRYGLINCEESISATINGESGSYPILAKVADTDWLDKTVAVTVENPDASVAIFDLNGNVSQEVEFEEVSGHVRVGDKVGHIQFKQDNEVIAECDLVAAEEMGTPGIIDRCKIWWKRTFGGLSKQHADSVVLNTTPLVGEQTENGEAEVSE